MFKETHPIIGTRDMRRAIAFYTGKLGFALAFRTDPGVEPDAEHPNYVGYRRDAVVLHMQFQYPHEMGTIRLLFPYYFHGPTSWRELRLLAEAGLSPVEILRAATVNAAEMLGIAGQVGTVDIGKVADLVVVEEDPLVDVARAMRSLRYTIRGGVARTPEAWMAAAPPP